MIASDPLPGWRPLSLGEMQSSGWLLIRNGYADGDHNEDGTGIPHLRPFNVTADGRIDLSKVKYVAPPDEHSTYWLEPGDIVFNNTNSEDLTGKTALFPGGRCTLSNHMTLVRVTDHTEVDPVWLASSLQELWRRGYFRSLLRRYVGQASVSLNRLKSVSLLVPPVDEQGAIAHVLGTVQQAREATEQVIAAARQFRRSLREYLYTYGPMDVAREHAVVTQETGIGRTPARWAIFNLGDLIREPLRNGRSAVASTSREGVRTLTLSAVTNNDFGVHNTKLTVAMSRAVQDLWLQPGDIFVERANTREMVGLAALYEGPPGFAIFPDLLIRVRPDSRRIDPKFLVEYLLTVQVRHHFSTNASGTAASMPKISQDVLSKVPVPVAPEDEQRQMASAMRAIDSKIAAEEQRRDALDALFKSLLKDLMTGKRRVSPDLVNEAAETTA